MPEDRLPPDLDHRLGTRCRLLTDAGAKSTSQNYTLHLKALTQPKPSGKPEEDPYSEPLRIEKVETPPQNEARQTPLLISIQKPVLTSSNIYIIQYTLIL